MKKFGLLAALFIGSLFIGLFAIASPAYATTNSTIGHGTAYTGDPYEYWNNSTYLGARDGQYSDIDLVPGWATWHNSVSAASFGFFEIPTSATISAIMVKVKGYATGSGGVRNIGFYLTRDNMATYQLNSAGNDLLWFSIPGSATEHIYTTNTSSAQFNAYHWSGADFNTNNFGVTMYADENTQNHFYIDDIQVQVTYITAGGSAGVTCDSWDVICQIGAWGSQEFNTIFGVNTTFANSEFTALQAIALTKFPLIYEQAVAFSDFGSPLGSPGAIPALYITWAPKWKVGAVFTDLPPVVISVTSDQFAVIQPFVTLMRTIFKVVLWLGAFLFIIYRVHHLFI